MLSSYKFKTVITNTFSCKNKKNDVDVLVVQSCNPRTRDVEAVEGPGVWQI